MATSQDFLDACTAAGAALLSLANRADELYTVATNVQDQGIAEQAKRFATVAGPKGLDRATSSGDANELMYLQRGIKGVTEDVDEQLVTDLVKRFLLFPISPLLALAPTEVLEDVSDALDNVEMPPAPQDVPLPIFLAGGAGVGALWSFISTGNPKMALAGAAGGALLGWGAHKAFSKIGELLTFKGFSS